MRRFSPYWHGFKRKKNDPEAQLVLSIIKYLRGKGYSAGKIKVKGFPAKEGGFIKDPYLMRGLPDIIVFKNTSMVFIEAKVGKNDLTPHQETFQLLCSQTSIPYLIARSIEDIRYI